MCVSVCLHVLYQALGSVFPPLIKMLSALKNNLFDSMSAAMAVNPCHSLLWLPPLPGLLVFFIYFQSSLIDLLLLVVAPKKSYRQRKADGKL